MLSRALICSTAFTARRATSINWRPWDRPARREIPRQAQGFGDEIAFDTPWVLGLGGEWWKLQPKEITDVFSQAGTAEVPFLSQPPRHYLGAA